MGKAILEEQATPSTPGADKVALYPKAGGKYFQMGDDGVECKFIDNEDFHPPAAVAFAGQSGRTITHNYGHTDYQIIINPVADPAGFLGELWYSKAANTVVVYNSGSATGNFDYVIIPSL